MQRNGRVIRLLSPHEQVFLTTMLPEPGELERLLRLESRLQAKIAAAGVFGMESGVIEDLESENQNCFESFVDRLVDGDATLLDEGEHDAGSFAGEVLRALLRRAAAEGEVGRLRDLPWGVGAAFQQGVGVPSSGPPGTFFACRTRITPEHRYWRYVRDDEVDVEELPMLRRIAPGGAVGVDTEEDLEPAWRLAVASIVAEHNHRADPAAVDDPLPASQRWALALLRDPDVALPRGADDADELLSVPRPGPVRAALSELRRAVDTRELSRDQAAERVIQLVDDYGLTVVPPPEPMSSISEDDVGVVCWMRVIGPRRD